MKKFFITVCIMLAMSLCVTGPVVKADDTQGAVAINESVVKAINLDNSVKAGDVFYFGTYTANNVEYAVPWVAMNDEGYVFSRYTLGKSVFSSDTTRNLYYPDSQLKTVMDGFYDGDNTLFTDSERSMIKSTTLTAESMDMGASKTSDIDAYVFPLSGWSIYTFSTNTRTYHGDCNTIKTVAAVNTYRSPTDITAPTGDEVPWWTRTKDKSTSYSKRDSDGNAIAYINYVNTAWWSGTPVSSRAPSTSGIYVRPALTLDTSSVLFRSAPSGKTLSTIGEDSLQKVEAYTGDGTDWKFTFLDSARSNFTANITKSNGGKVVLGKYATIEYSGAKTGDNEYISAMILNIDGELLYYGQVAKSQESGTVQVYLPKDIEAGSYTLRIFNEQLNDDYKSDFSSAFVDISITAFEDTTAPTGWVTVYHNGSNEHSGYYGGEFTGQISKTYDREPDDYCNSAIVEIGAKDDSGCDVIIEYFVTNKSYTRDELETVEFSLYTEPLEFGSEYDGKDIAIYGKLTDISGNVSYINYLWYISVDVTFPVISGIENGKTYCGKQTVTVTDDHLYGVLLNGTYQMNSFDDFCKPFTLEINPASGEQTLKTYDLAMNYTTYTFTINDGHTAEDDDGDCTTDIKCKYCGEVLTKGYESHDYVYDDEASSFLNGGNAYLCSHTGCDAYYHNFNLSAIKIEGETKKKDENITITTATGNKNAKEGETVTISYNLKGYNVQWTVETVLSESVTVTPDANDPLKATFTMPAFGVEVSATAKLKQFNVVYNYISDAGEVVTENKMVNYGDNFVLSTASTRIYQGYNFEFCCWRISYTINGLTQDKTLTTSTQTTPAGTDTIFIVDFLDESLTYRIYSHYMTGVELSFIVTEPFAEENPSFDVDEKNHYIFIDSDDVWWLIGEYDGNTEYPSNLVNLLAMDESQTFVEGETYTVFIWVNLHNEFATVKKASEGGSLGYVNPIINGAESKWLCIDNTYGNYIMTYYTFTAKQVRTDLGIASGAAYYDENGYEISGEISSDYTSIKASVGDKLYLVLTAIPNEGYEFDAWEVNEGDVIVQKDEKGYYIIVNKNATFISPTFKKIQYTVKVDILGEVTEQKIEYGTIFELVTDETLSDGRVFTGWIYEDEDGEDYLWENDTDITIDHNCTVKAYYGIPVTPEFYIQMPIVGENPTYEVHEKYEGTLGEDPDNNDGSGITWYLYDPDNNKYTELDKDYIFEADALYNITLCLNLTTSGYAWAKDEDGYLVYPKLNGNSLDYDGWESIYEWFSVTYSLFTERYDVTATNGTVLVNTFSASQAGQYDVITVTANEAEVGKAFDKWIVSDIDTSSLDLTNTELTFTMPAHAVTVEATYKNIDYAITVNNGTADKQTANYGDSITITADEAPEGKVFKGWQDESGNIVSTDATYMFTISSALCLTAVYEDKTIDKDEPKSLSGGAIAGIVIGSIAVVGIGGFLLFWFVIKKKKLSDLFKK